MFSSISKENSSVKAHQSLVYLTRTHTHTHILKKVENSVLYKSNYLHEQPGRSVLDLINS